MIQKAEAPSKSLAELMGPPNLDYYRNLVRGMNPRRLDVAPDVQLNADQAAVVFKVHDHGIGCLQQFEVDLLHQVISKLKMEIWP